MIIILFLVHLLTALPIKRPLDSAFLTEHPQHKSSLRLPNDIVFHLMKYSGLQQSVRIAKLLDWEAHGDSIDWELFNPLSYHDASLDHQWAIKNWSLASPSDYFYLLKLTENHTVDFRLLDNSVLLDLINDNQIALLDALLKRGVEPDHWTILEAWHASREIFDIILRYY